MLIFFELSGQILSLKIPVEKSDKLRVLPEYRLFSKPELLRLGGFLDRYFEKSAF